MPPDVLAHYIDVVALADRPGRSFNELVAKAKAGDLRRSVPVKPSNHMKIAAKGK